MINGETIKQARRARGMSQKTLARGITTQATISQIENGTSTSNSEVITKIVARLGLTTEDITETTQLRNVKQSLFQANIAAQKYDFVNVAKILSHTKISNITDSELCLHYQFLKADSSMWITKDFSAAVFDFNKLLLDATNKKKEIYVLLATCELGVAYENMQEKDRSDYYYSLISNQLKAIDVSDNIFWILFVINNLVVYLSKNDHFNESNKFAEKGLKVAQDNQVYYFVDIFYYSMALNHYQTSGWTTVALGYLTQGWSFAKFSNDDIIIKLTEKRIKENGIDII